MFETYAATWPMCAASFAFFLLVAALTWWVSIPRLDPALPPKIIYRLCLAAWFVLLAVCLTLIDKPHFALSKTAKEWLFMFSAFLGVPVSVPFLAGAVWSLARQSGGGTVKLSMLVLVMLGSFSLACAASNIHDIVFCAVITNGYEIHYKSGFDLDLFVAFGRGFGIPAERLADYATLGPYTVVLVLGEILVAVTAFARLQRARSAAK
jgi:hypothetical protein